MILKCEMCGKEFEQKCNHQHFCSPFCRQKHHIKKQRSIVKEGTPVKCKYCGKEFLSHTNKKFCSPECIRLDKNQKRRKVDAPKVIIPMDDTKELHFGKITVVVSKEGSRYVWKAYNGEKKVLTSVETFESIGMAVKDVHRAF